jgi:ribosomal-protein-alanine N-acetyltransferase
VPLPPDPIVTARLVLRPARVADAAPIFERYAQDPEVTRFLLWAPHRAVSETVEFLCGCEAAWETGAYHPFAICLARDDAPVGMVDVRPRGHAAEVGYVLARPLWGRGYMSEALRAVCDVALATPELFRVWGVCDVTNVASGRVMEKAGMTYEGRLARFLVLPNLGPEPRDVSCYSRTR